MLAAVRCVGAVRCVRLSDKRSRSLIICRAPSDGVQLLWAMQPKQRELPPTPLLSKRVRIHGLSDDQDEFNGAFGRTLTFKTDTGCYMVVVEGSEQFLELSPANLSDASAQGVSDASAQGMSGVSESSSDVSARAGKDVQKQTEHVARMQLAPDVLDANGNKVAAGARVEIFGLQSKPALNNTFGRVVAYKRAWLFIGTNGKVVI